MKAARAIAKKAEEKLELPEIGRGGNGPNGIIFKTGKSK
jgi:hypothetical protein